MDLPGSGWSPLGGRGAGLMDHRRLLSRFIAELATGDVIVSGNSMGGAIGILQAAVEPSSLNGLVLTASVFPWARGAWPHPAVMGAFAMYDLPGIGERLVSARVGRVDPERVVRLALWLTTSDPSRIPPDVVRMNVELIRERRDDPDGPRAYVEAARSLLRLGRRPDVARRALDRVACPVLVLHGRRDRLVPAAFAEATLARYPTWRGRIFPDLGHVPQMEDPGRWLGELARLVLRRSALSVSPAGQPASDRTDRSMPAASSPMSGTASQSAVRPNAIVPPRLVQATDKPELSPSGIAG